jgi:hypothetical protein
MSHNRSSVMLCPGLVWLLCLPAHTLIICRPSLAALLCQMSTRLLRKGTDRCTTTFISHIH